MEVKLNNCFFAMFDIIGFSNLVKKIGTQELFKQYNKSVLFSTQYAAAKGMINQTRDGQNVSIPDIENLTVNYQIFSDTILFYTKDDSFESYCDIIITAAKFMTFSFLAPAPYRGAIGYGDLLTNDLNVMIGTSVIDAYLGEQIQVWSGCMLTEECQKFCESQNYFDRYREFFQLRIDEINNDDEKIQDLKEWQNAVVKYDVPKQRKISKYEIEYFSDNHVVINWTYWVGKGVDIEGAFQASENPHHQKILKNTLDFDQWARQL